MTPAMRMLGRSRLRSQSVSPAAAGFRSPADVVRWMTAMQAQDFPAAKWAVGLRLPGSTDADIESALADRSIVRSWPLRGTLHFVASEDLHWMLELTRERMLKKSASTFAGEGLTDSVLGRAGDAALAALSGGRTLTRDAVYDLLAEAGVAPAGQARYHALWYLCQIGLLCMGPPQGKAQTFVLLDEWVPRPRRVEHDEALGELALRYFRSHGPATERDFSWWSSLSLTESRTGMMIAGDALERREVDGIAYYSSPGLPQVTAATGTQLLPGFDEYLLGYTDRSAALAEAHAPLVVPGKNGMFLATIVVDGAVVGTWKRALAAKHVSVSPHPFAPLSGRIVSSVRRAATEYAEFLGLEPRLPA